MYLNDMPIKGNENCSKNIKSYFPSLFPNKTEIVADIYHHFLSLLYNRHTQPIAYQVWSLICDMSHMEVIDCSCVILELSGDDFQKMGLNYGL